MSLLNKFFSTLGGAGALAPLIRTVSAYNRINTKTVATAGANGLFSTGQLRRNIGSADVDMLQVSSRNWFADAVTQKIVGSGGSVTINEMYLRCNGIVAQVTWGGASSIVLANLADDIRSDFILPAAFGLTVFPRDIAITIKYKKTYPTGAKLMQTESQYADGAYGDPSVTTVSGVGSTGSITYTGTNPTYATGEADFLLGHYVAGDARCFLGTGDSHFMNSGSWFEHALYQNNTDRISGINFSRGSGNWSLVTGNQDIYKNLVGLCSAVVEEFGTNLVGPGNVATCKSSAQACWSVIRAGVKAHPDAIPFKLLRTQLLMKTSGTFSTLIGQTINSTWDSGNTVELFNTWLGTQVGVGNGPDVICDVSDGVGGILRGSATGSGTVGADYYKFSVDPAPVTGDGLHLGSTIGVPIAGANLRVYLDALM